ncbi:MAG: TIR domain-containing protein [Clostridia bacterium]|nr:TIR domain-containing protein [Clostridia bacterium]
MAIIKCKMCGGDIELSADKTYGVCEFCGSTTTFPRIDDDHRANLFNRANHFRRQNEFDKAVSAYERILETDNADAEAHWGVVISRFGIEYVVDPASGMRIPTCHRVQSASILTDADYLAALEYAPDAASRSIYEAQAHQIAEIQKGILAISAQEKPCDVFICYKESAPDGSRTKDSTLAQDIYYQLKQEGFNVFFSRITLEDKLGQQYEPYIFAALNSAKVMLVVGTKPEYFNAVWVKNEWGRYLSLMKQDHARLLIPCYRDMDPYELPDELSALQSQDMGRIGFMQDLIRGVKKVLSASKPQQSAPAPSAPSPAGAVAPLLRRAFMFLEDGDWNAADEYCEKVLDMEPENAEAYLGKLMAVLQARKREELPDLPLPFDRDPNYQKVLRFGDEKLKAELQGYIRHINTRNENARLEGLYQQGIKMMQAARSAKDYKGAVLHFQSLGAYKDAAEKAVECHFKIEDARKNDFYRDACQKMKTNTEKAQLQAIQLFESIKGWRDADERIVHCQEQIQEIRKQEQRERIAWLRAEKLAAQRRRQRQIMLAIAAAAAVVILAIVLLITQVIIPNNKYNAAVALKNAGKYSEAYDAFIGLNGHKDSKIKANSIFDKAMAEKRSKAKVGDYITFGSYEQDNNTRNGKEAIEWRVLAKENNRLLVISRYALDCKRYNESRTNVTWETCTLRKWLNNNFLKAAFSSAEQAMIPTMTVAAHKNPNYSTEPGNDTQDKIFLLSITEAEKYFSSDSAMKCKPTAYAEKQGVNTSAAVYADIGNAYAEKQVVKTNSDVYCWWWLRSPGDHQLLAAYVYSHGGVRRYGGSVNTNDYAVRPALWIDLAP